MTAEEMKAAESGAPSAPLRIEGVDISPKQDEGVLKVRAGGAGGPGPPGAAEPEPPRSRPPTAPGSPRPGTGGTGGGGEGTAAPAASPDRRGVVVQPPTGCSGFLGWAA